MPGYRKLVMQQIPFIFITNPLVEGLTTESVKTDFLNGVLNNYSNYIPAFCVHQLLNSNETIDFAAQFKGRKIALIHYAMPANIINTLALLSDCEIAFQIFHVQNLSKAYLSDSCLAQGKKIILIDGFNKQQNNAMYASNTDEYFSNHFKSFKEKGFDGISDFLTIGEKYSQPGGAGAHAVVIHWTYHSSKKDEIMINHFVSDRREGTEDPAGKFGEAYRHLEEFALSYENFEQTNGWKMIHAKGKAGKFPSLGAVKKFSIMNHIEIVRSLIDR